jgi:YHS domain-containing protein
MLAVFWGVMTVAGLVTEGVFRAADLVPAARPAHLAVAHFRWDYTTWLDIAALVLFALVYWVYRHRERLGGGSDLALDPVCGMQVETAGAPASTVHAGRRWYFCSDRCLGRFEESPERWTPERRDAGSTVAAGGATPAARSRQAR